MRAAVLVPFQLLETRGTPHHLRLSLARVPFGDWQQHVGTALAALTLLVAVPSAGAAQAAAAPRDSLTLARQYVAWFYAAQWDSLIAHHPAALRAEATLRLQLEDRLEDLTRSAGTEVTLVGERFVRLHGALEYWRTAQFSTFPEPVLIRWVFDQRRQIVGIGMGPLSQAPTPDPVKP
jgi:hypothetical protein